VANSEGKGQNGRYRSTWDDIIKADIKEIVWN
jgi:hypothetical protein